MSLEKLEKEEIIRKCINVRLMNDVIEERYKSLVLLVTNFNLQVGDKIHIESFLGQFLQSRFNDFEFLKELLVEFMQNSKEIVDEKDLSDIISEIKKL